MNSLSDDALAATSNPAADVHVTRGRPRAPLLAHASCQFIALSDIRSEHPLLSEALNALHPRPIDDALVLTPEAVHLLCSLHPPVVRPVGRGQKIGYEVLAGLLAWQVLRSHHKLLLGSVSSTQLPTPPDSPAAETAKSDSTVSGVTSARGRSRRTVSPTRLPTRFKFPVLVLPRDMSPNDINTLLTAERWLLLTCVGPLTALQSELAHLRKQAQDRQWIDDLTPGIKSLAALARVLGTSRQALHLRRRPTASVHDDPSADGS